MEADSRVTVQKSMFKNLWEVHIQSRIPIRRTTTGNRRLDAAQHEQLDVCPIQDLLRIHPCPMSTTCESSPFTICSSLTSFACILQASLPVSQLANCQPSPLSPHAAVTQVSLHCLQLTLMSIYVFKVFRHPSSLVFMDMFARYQQFLNLTRRVKFLIQTNGDGAKME